MRKSNSEYLKKERNYKQNKIKAESKVIVPNNSKLATKSVDKDFVDTIKSDSEATMYKAKGKAKLIIPNSTWSQIQNLLLRHHSTEWSGVLYFTDNAARNINDLVITAQYLFPMNVGSTGYTTFNWQKKEVLVFEALQDKDGLEWRKGCLHSHNSMSVFFSGEDNADLKEQALYHHYYLSVIVNNKQEVIARLSHKLSTSEIESIFGKVELSKSVVYYDVDVEVEQSVFYQDNFEKGLSSMTMFKGKTYGHNVNPSVFTSGKTWNNQGKQGTFWNSDNWNPKEVFKSKSQRDMQFDELDLLTFFNENEIIPNQNELNSLEELETALTVYFNSRGFDSTEFMNDVCALWDIMYSDISKEEVFAILEDHHFNIQYIFKVLYS